MSGCGRVCVLQVAIKVSHSAFNMNFRRSEIVVSFMLDVLVIWFINIQSYVVEDFPSIIRTLQQTNFYTEYSLSTHHSQEWSLFGKFFTLQQRYSYWFQRLVHFVDHYLYPLPQSNGDLKTFINLVRTWPTSWHSLRPC